MREFQEELAEAVENLDRHYSELKATARQRLGSLFNAGGLPRIAARACSPSSSISPAWNRRTIFSSSTRQLYEEECRRVQARFDEAVRLAEEAFTAELAKLVSPPDRAAFGPGGWQAEDLPGFGGREPDRVLPAVPRAERPLQRATRPARGRRPAGHPRRGAAGPARQRRAAAARRHGDVAGAERAGRPAGGPAPAQHPPPPASDERSPCNSSSNPAGLSGASTREEIDLAALGSPAISRAIARRAGPAGTLVGRPLARPWSDVGTIPLSQRGPCGRAGVAGSQVAGDNRMIRHDQCGFVVVDFRASGVFTMQAPLSHSLPNSLPRRIRLRANRPYMRSSTPRMIGNRVGATSQPRPTAL